MCKQKKIRNNKFIWLYNLYTEFINKNETGINEELYF